MLDLRVLGPVRAHRSGRQVGLSAMLRRLLAALLSRSGTPLPAAALVEALWDGAPPPSARKTLQVYVRRLRQAVGDPDRIRHGPGGYTVLVGADELDALRFADLAARARTARDRSGPEPAAALYGQALDLWRGDAYADLADLPFVADEARRLEEERLVVYEEATAARLLLGLDTLVVGELTATAGRHPYRERLHALLMFALCRAGRQAEALAVYRRAWDTLRDDLGVAPGELLRRAHETILREGGVASLAPELLDADLAGLPPAGPAILAGSGVPPPAARVGFGPGPCSLPPDLADFTGRDGAVAAALRQLDARPGNGPGPGEGRTALPVVAVSGAPGSGKTALLVHVAHRLRAAYPDGQLYVDLRGADDPPADPGAVLGRLLVALGLPRSAVPAGRDERGELFRAAVAGRRVLLVLDHAAGEAQVRPLLPGSPSCGVLVAGRCRLAGLSAYPLGLPAFDHGSAVDLLARVAGADRVAPEPEAAAAIVRHCAGLPLAVRIAGARLRCRGHWTPRTLADRLRPPERRLDELVAGDLSVRASLAAAYAALDPAGRRALPALGRLDAAGFTARTAAAALGVTVVDAEACLDHLVDRQVLVGPGGADPRFRFPALTRLYARELCGA